MRQNGIPEPEWLDKPIADWPGSVVAMYSIIARWAIKDAEANKKGDDIT